jgi:hypothetical protein
VGIDRPGEGDDQPDSPEGPEPRRHVREDPRELPDRATYFAEYKKTVEAEYRAYAIDQGCDHVEKIEKEIVTPEMHRIEAEDPDRHLVGLDFRLKGRDRVEEKITRQMDSQPDLTYQDAFASLKDAIRYTFAYPGDRYSDGVKADVDRLKSSGFELTELRNSWTNEEYKGINSRWRAPGGGQLFEVQFHTQESFEAKQRTHPAYEKLRNPATPKAQRDEMEDFQHQVTSRIPVPRGATDIPNYP